MLPDKFTLVMYWLMCYPESGKAGHPNESYCFNKKCYKKEIIKYLNFRVLVKRIFDCLRCVQCYLIRHNLEITAIVQIRNDFIGNYFKRRTDKYR